MVLDKLKEIIIKAVPGLDASEIEMDSLLMEDLGLDSLTMLVMAVSIEDEFGFRFGKDLKLETVKDVCDYIESQKK